MPPKRRRQKGSKSTEAPRATTPEMTTKGALEVTPVKKCHMEKKMKFSPDINPPGTNVRENLEQILTVTGRDAGENLKEAPESASPTSTPKVDIVSVDLSSDSDSDQKPQSPEPAGLGKEKFENLLGHPLTHPTCMLMLKNMVASSSTKQTSGLQAGSDESSVKDDAVPGPSPKLPSLTGPSGEGVGMINELWSRYEKNKKTTLYGSQEPKKICDDPDDDDYDIDAVYADTFGDEKEDDDFLKYSVPQYELKKQLCDIHHSAVKRMSRAETVKACKELIPVLKNIMKESIPSKRHDIFKNCGLSRMELHQLAITEPFTADQHYECSNTIISALSPDGELEKSSGRFMYYVSDVMIPECFVRIYTQVNNVSIEFAEKELRFGPSYDGELDEELIKTLPNGKDSTSKVK